MADYNVNMKQWNGSSFDNVLPLAYNALKFGDKTYSEFSKIEIGTYVGNGTVGESTPTVIACGFKPRIVVIGTVKKYGSSWASYSGYYYNFGQLSSSATGLVGGYIFPSIIIDDGFESPVDLVSKGSADYGVVLHKTFTDNGISIYAKFSSDDASSRLLNGSHQFNANNTQYSYVAIG